MAGLFDLLGKPQGGGLFPGLSAGSGDFGAPVEAGPFSGLINNQNAILGYLAGALQGGNLGESIGRGLQGWQNGAQADTQLSNQRQAQRAALGYVAGAQDVDPALRSALVASPALAAQYLTQRLKPTDVPHGFVRTPAGGLTPIPGGPADPAYLGRVNALREPHIAQQIEQRLLAAKAQGLDVNHPSVKAYVLTGRMPRDVQPPNVDKNPQ
jgi:hypothetical protein